ncbi:MAG: hypothetical protein F4Z13_05655 [Candidatus Dadabacteria bacterium]|nr:hypothetical protein [Candidatus Dadabacteria bacterium]MYI73543.1 hypothetical protein [Candidatus Dadabacteria bacterium]
MEKKFHEVTCLLVNVAVFDSASSGDLGIPENLSAPELLQELRSLEVEIVFYGPGARHFVSTNGFGGLVEENGHLITADRAYVLDSVGRKDSVLLGSELSDIDFFLSGIFSVSPSSAPLDLKAVSSYVSNFDGEAVFTELGNLIVNSKREDRE